MLRSVRGTGLLLVTGVPLLMCGFASGYICCLRARSAPPSDMRQRELLQPGDAPPAVRAGVLASLREFQQGYARRDPNQIQAFMQSLFPRNGDILSLGTGGGTAEWVRGYDASAQFIQSDWRGWGEVQLDTDHALVWSSGDVAWVASLGTVQFQHTARPLRFTAILTRQGDRWLFRQLHFQWDDSDPDATDLLHPHAYFRALRVLAEDLFR